MTTDAAKRPRKGHPLQFDTQPDPAPCQPGADTALKFTVEAFYGGKRVFDFQDLMPLALARVFADGLKLAAGTGGTVRTMTTVVQYQNAVRRFFAYLSEPGNSIADPGHLRGEHIDGFERWLESLGMRPLHRNQVLSRIINCLRLAAAQSPNLLHTGLCERLRYVSDQPAGRSHPRDAYSPFVARQLRNAARTDIALIRARYDQPTALDPTMAERLSILDAIIVSEGVVSHNHLAFRSLYRDRYKLGMKTPTLVEDLHRRHHLLADDIVPFLVLLSLETGLEIECCKDLTIDCLKNPAAHTIEIAYIKRRARGSEWKGLRVRDDGALSPGGLIRTLIHLTDFSRRCKQSENLWLHFADGALVSGMKHPQWILDKWVSAQGIVDDSGAPLHLLLSRLRKTQKALWYLKTEGEIRDFAIGHTPEVAARHYADIPALRHIHQKAVADGLQDALDAALKPYVLSPEEEDRLQRESGTADLSHPLSRITTALDGNHDLWLASCSDFFESPFGYSGQPCPQPFWGCFECHNAVITARKLPAILQFLDFITGQRATLSEAHWAAKFGRVWRRITAQILPAFPVAVVEDARRTQAVLQDALYLPPEVAVA